MEDKKDRKKDLSNPYGSLGKPLLEISIGEYQNPYSNEKDRLKKEKHFKWPYMP